MLKLQANLIHKPTTMRQPVCQIEKIIELPQDEFISLSHHPNADYSFIAENRGLMRERNGVYHCLLVLDKDGTDGILINAEGYDSVRYGAFVSHARDFVMKQMEQVTDSIIKDAVSNTSSGSWITYFEEIIALSGVEISNENGYAPLLLQALEARPELAEIEMNAEGYDIVYYLCHCTNLEDNALEAQDPGGIKLRDVLLLGSMENVYMVHDTADVGFIPASYTAMSTDKGREEHAELLGASVKEIRSGAYGPEIILSGVDPELLVNFDLAAAAHIQAESMMGPTL